jgi:dTDP-4-amino-4,6-dideoxygalactose transaminase
MNDFSKDPVTLKDSVINEISNVIDSGWFVLGKTVSSFEKKFSSMMNIDYGIGVANGMDAIEIILRSKNIGPGDEVITTSMTAFPTVLAIIRAGATPVLSDINEATGLMSLSSAKACITKKTKAILLVHLYGQIKDMDSWLELTKNNNIDLIEDCAQSHLAAYNGITAGNFGIAGAFSFYPTKNLGAYGDAGFIATNDINISESAKILRDYGQTAKYSHDRIGLNSRLDEVQAAILIQRMEILIKQTKRRQDIATAYFDNLSNKKIKLLKEPESKESHVFHLFVLLCNNRSELQKYLLDNEIQTNIHYPLPMHNQKAVTGISHDANGLGNSELHANKCLSIPCHPNMTDNEVDKVIDIINNF